MCNYRQKISKYKNQAICSVNAILTNFKAKAKKFGGKEGIFRKKKGENHCRERFYA